MQFEVQQFVDNRNRLYLAVALTKIETGVVGNTAPLLKEATSLIPISNISLAEGFKNINTFDEKFLKYIPKQFLDNEQIKAKNKAIESDRIKYIGEFVNTKNKQSSISKKSDVQSEGSFDNIPRATLLTCEITSQKGVVSIARLVYQVGT